MIMRTLVVTLLACSLLTCTPSKEVQKRVDEETFNDQIVKYEATFRPSDYDPDPDQKNGKVEDRSTEAQKESPGTQTTSSTELVPGFRVQVFSLSNIDEARAKKVEIESLFPGEWVYLEYESPAYKIRAGNFLSRFEADRFANQLRERGYDDTWTVPARVVKNPPPAPLPYR